MTGRSFATSMARFIALTWTRVRSATTRTVATAVYRTLASIVELPSDSRPMKFTRPSMAPGRPRDGARRRPLRRSDGAHRPVLGRVLRSAVLVQGHAPGHCIGAGDGDAQSGF